jgi:hypothetical protein
MKHMKMLRRNFDVRFSLWFFLQGMNDQCRICIETTYEKVIDQMKSSIPLLFKSIVGALKQSVDAGAFGSDAGAQVKAEDIITKLGLVSESITTTDIEDFFFYYVTREVYASLGYSEYLKLYAALPPVIAACEAAAASGLPAVCPPTNITADDAKQALRNHTDAEFSSVTTAGAPFPFWSAEDGNGILFLGNFPVGGSGVNMSNTMTSASEFLNSTLLAGGVLNPTSNEWAQSVETNPMYSYVFLASFVFVCIFPCFSINLLRCIFLGGSWPASQTLLRGLHAAMEI